MAELPESKYNLRLAKPGDPPGTHKPP
jgi:hypothetical protein